MEDLVPKNYRSALSATESEILSVVKEFLADEKTEQEIKEIAAQNRVPTEETDDSEAVTPDTPQQSQTHQNKTMTKVKEAMTVIPQSS